MITIQLPASMLLCFLSVPPWFKKPHSFPSLPIAIGMERGVERARRGEENENANFGEAYRTTKTRGHEATQRSS